MLDRGLWVRTLRTRILAAIAVCAAAGVMTGCNSPGAVTGAALGAAAGGAVGAGIGSTYDNHYYYKGGAGYDDAW